MELPALLGGDDYMDGLRIMRDEALRNSYREGKLRLGRLALGNMSACWRNEEAKYGLTFLRYQKFLFLGSTTTLETYMQHGDDRVWEVRTFKIDFDNGGLVDVYRTVAEPSDTVKAYIEALKDQRRQRTLELSWPSDEDYITLWQEMARGASGEHRVPWIEAEN